MRNLQFVAHACFCKWLACDGGQINAHAQMHKCLLTQLQHMHDLSHMHVCDLVMQAELDAVLQYRASVDAAADELARQLLLHPETSDMLIQNNGWPLGSQGKFSKGESCVLFVFAKSARLLCQPSAWHSLP